MSVLNPYSGFTNSVLGKPASKAYSPLVVETKDLFVVAGGLVVVTALVGKVTTAITVANTVKVQANPTVGTTQDLCAATDLGTTDTPAGNLITVSGAPTAAPVSGVGAVPLGPISKVSADFLGSSQAFVVAPGTIQQVTATGADGGITWICTWVPLEDGATLAAA
ncbi:MAG TPA: hypothetical protein VFG15_06310 [Amycolatopsis sp.]|nr:hypothetical protein [Amycolatopsis sp.]